MANDPPEHWSPDDYTQAEPDYTGSPTGKPKVNTPRRSGKCSTAANTAKTRRWRQSHASHRREYMRRYMAARRAGEKRN